MKDDFIVFGSPQIADEEIDEVVRTLRSGWIGTGPRVARFEAGFREYIGASHAVALNSCTAALHVSMLVAGLSQGEEVLTTPLTFVATANAIIHAGGLPRFIDVDRSTQTIDPAAVRRFLENECERIDGTTVNRRSGRAVRALLPVHFAGRPCAMDELEALAREYDLLLIEDAAHAIEAEYRGRKIGTIGDLTCFSFYVTKNMTTGEGGMVTTRDERLAAAIKTLSLHGLSQDAWKRYSDQGFKHYEVTVPGFKYNMMDLQAAIGLHQLARIEANWRRRAEIWNRYDAAFCDLPVTLPAPPEPDTRHALHLYTVLVDRERAGIDRDDLQQRLFEAGVGSGVHYVAVHLHAYYRDAMRLQRGDFPNAEFISDRTLSLPLSAKLTDADVERVMRTVRRALGAAPGGPG
ncbi:MAG TPA: DegT/DnrJ/EryC1/StrS aminotransferase family protein [Longimicrobiales bacterium]|nr:DegT/DnrJ/EryC1/StrS aminotransferase family protein [Longimicrobiales bacterium]